MKGIDKKFDQNKEEQTLLWDSDSLSKALELSVKPGIAANGVSIDTRTIKRGNIYIAIKGEKFDGNDFALEALEKGASLVVVNSSSALDSLQPYESQVLAVGDTFAILNKLAVYARNRIKGKVIGITGSVGKTTTKEMLKLVLNGQGNCYASKGNFNNHYGTPLCLANMPTDTDYAVIEMGMSGVGELGDLSKLFRPDIAVVTNVEAVHLQFFSSVSGIAAAKAEIFQGMKTDDIAIINFDNPYHQILLTFALEKKLKILSFGSDQKTNFKLEKYEIDKGKTYVKAECLGRDIDYVIGATGLHLVFNSLAVLAAVHAIGAELLYASKQLSKFNAPEGRGQVHKVNSLKITLIDDSYNASPASVKAALTNLASYRSKKGRLVAVLGNMLELGKDAEELHLSLLDEIIKNRIDRVYTVGNLMEKLYKKLPANIAGLHADSSKDMSRLISKEIIEGDVILVKGSNSVGMCDIIKVLNK